MWEDTNVAIQIILQSLSEEFKENISRFHSDV